MIVTHLLEPCIQDIVTHRWGIILEIVLVEQHGHGTAVVRETLETLPVIIRTEHVDDQFHSGRQRCVQVVREGKVEPYVLSGAGDRAFPETEDGACKEVIVLRQGCPFVVLRTGVFQMDVVWPGC